MYVHHVVGTESYTTSTTNMYHKDRFHVHRGGGDFWSIPAVPGVCRCRCFTVSLLMQQHLRIMFGEQINSTKKIRGIHSIRLYGNEDQPYWFEEGQQ